MAVDCKIEKLKIGRTIASLTKTFNYLPIMLPTAVLAPSYFRSEIKMGEVTQASQAFNILGRTLSFFANDYTWLSHIGASLERLTAFVDFVDPAQSPSQLQNGVPAVLSQIHTKEIASTRELILRDVTLRTPGTFSRVLISNASVHVRQSERLLIVGSSGAGKTSLLRAIAGLWVEGSGDIERPTREQAFFLPQRPYCVLGTLRDQLLYPRTSSQKGSDIALLDALNRVGLPHLARDVGGLDETQNWTDVLSVGETQRLAFARLLLSDAQLAIIDEGTSALDLASEAAVMRLACEKPGRLLVSVGHRPSLLHFHDTVLSISEDTSCKVIPAKQFSYPTFQ